MPHDALGLGEGRGDRGDRKRRGVGGEDRVVAADLGQAAISSRFSSRSSGAASITSSQPREVLERGRGATRADRRIGVGLAPQSLLGAAAQRVARGARSRRRARRRRGRGGGSRSRPARRPARSRRPSCRRRRRLPARRSPLGSASARYLPRKSGAALLEEGPHALDAVVGRHRQLVEAALVLEARGLRPLSSAASTACFAGASPAAGGAASDSGGPPPSRRRATRARP